VSDVVPLVEFDEDREAVVDPRVSYARHLNTLPERAVLCFYSEILDSLPHEAEKVGELVAAHGRHPIWRVNRHGVDIAVVHPGVGAPLAAAFLEEVIAMGAERVVACGGCGTVSPDVQPGAIVIPDAALRDEGTSFHYAPPSREIAADPHGVAVAVEVLERRGVPFIVGKTWTTDAIYRETRGKVRRRREEGCLVVEMEAAAFFAVARFRDIHFAQLLYGGDDVSGETWDDRDWIRSPSRRLTFDLALEVAAQL
jgi:uridine phosphorylase